MPKDRESGKHILDTLPQVSFSVNDVAYLGELADWLDGYATGRFNPKEGQICVEIPVEQVKEAIRFLRRIGLYGAPEQVLKELVDG